MPTSYSSLNAEIDSAIALLQAAKSSAAVGDNLTLEDSLVDVYNRLSKLLRTMQADEGRHFASRQQNVALWRGRNLPE